MEVLPYNLLWQLLVCLLLYCCSYVYEHICKQILAISLMKKKEKRNTVEDVQLIQCYTLLLPYLLQINVEQNRNAINMVCYYLILGLALCIYYISVWLTNVICPLKAYLLHCILIGHVTTYWNMFIYCELLFSFISLFQSPLGPS